LLEKCDILRHKSKLSRKANHDLACINESLSNEVDKIVLENKSLKELNVESHAKEIHDLRECNKQFRIDLEKFTKG